MAGRKPKKVGMTMMYDDGLLPVMVFELYIRGSGIVYSNNSVNPSSLEMTCYVTILDNYFHGTESEVIHLVISDYTKDYCR